MRVDRLRSVLIVAAAILLIGVVAAIWIVSARSHLLQGAQRLKSTESTLHPTTALYRGSAHKLRRTLTAAEKQFSAARDDLRLVDPLLVRLGWVPVLGPQLAASSPAANAGYYTTRGTIRLLDGLAPVIDTPTGHTFGTQLAAALASAQPQLDAASADLRRATGAANDLPAGSGNASLDRARAQLLHDLPLLRSTVRWLRAAPLLLGAGGPTRYLVLFQNPAELRATGGFIGAAGYLVAVRGRIHSTVTSSALSHEIESVAPPLPEALYTAEGPWIFRDSNWSPDFPLTARIARWFYGQDTGRWVDGVVGLQDRGIGDILSGTGPVYVPQYGIWVTFRNLERAADRYVNGTYKGPLRGAPEDVRKQFFHWVTRALLNRLQSLPVERWSQLGAAISRAIARRDLMIYDRRPTVASVLSSAHADGRFTAPKGDVLAIVDDNRSYNKINPYIGEEASYAAIIHSDLSIDATLSIHYTVHRSPPELEGKGPGFGALGSKHDYEDFLRVFVPRGARLRSMRGVDRWAPAQAYGMTQFAGRMLLREGESRTVTIRYTVPANALAPDFNRYRLTVWHQPGSALHGVHIEVAGTGGVVITGRATSGPRVTALPFDTDAHLAAEISGIGDPKLAQLPPLPAHPDPYLPWADLRDPGHSP